MQDHEYQTPLPLREKGYYPSYPPPQPMKKKSVAASVLFSMMIPGLGHMYLGLMKRGMSYMIGLVLNIFLISMISTNGEDLSIYTPLMILVCLCIPVLYFYCIFDGVHRARMINSRGEDALWTYTMDELPVQPPIIGGGLVVIGGLLLLSQTAPVLMNTIVRDYGGTAIALLLIGGGGWLLYRMK
ncbi:hypothetical protein [Gorillibacterium timonense]|uniref:hypothetical protein n=1 Tax=Gorillibacterium timonense TaxID=1689269 RepID=UPI00071DFFD7|nr:hypothetical protein [Gorillibacterium timonense]